MMTQNRQAQNVQTLSELLRQSHSNHLNRMSLKVGGATASERSVYFVCSRGHGRRTVVLAFCMLVCYSARLIRHKSKQ